MELAEGPGRGVTPPVFVTTALMPALSLLPPQMDSPEAQALIVSICLQESGLTKRRQLGGGPARGWAQFERVGIRGVLKHERSKAHARALCDAVTIAANVEAIHRAIEFHDVLTAGLARLLLWTLPDKLPARTSPIDAWYCYIEAWRPGKPREGVWTANWEQAWTTIEGES